MLPTTPTYEHHLLYPKFNDMNFGAPQDVAEEDCGTLPALVGHEEGGVFDGGPKIVTFWKPSEDEILALVQGGSIEIAFWANHMDPMAVNVVRGTL
jgi:hypothetical protein